MLHFITCALQCASSPTLIQRVSSLCAPGLSFSLPPSRRQSGRRGLAQHGRREFPIREIGTDRAASPLSGSSAQISREFSKKKCRATRRRRQSLLLLAFPPPSRPLSDLHSSRNLEQGTRGSWEIFYSGPPPPPLESSMLHTCRLSNNKRAQPLDNFLPVWPWN